MDMDQAAVFLAGSILTVMGFLIILVGIVIANNIIHKYWKPFGWTFMPNWSQETPRFASQEELDRIAPQFEEHKK
jgi:uncharacterized membrane protein